MTWMTDAAHLFGMFTRDSEKRSAHIYELLSTHNCLGESSLYLNAGYWDGATRYDDACQRLAEVLGEAAELRPGCAVLDCGCGFGDAAMFWIRRFDPATIDCLNITPVQVEKARERIDAAGLSQRVRVHLGSATRMPFADASLDRVVALETAFHFDTREDFFREALRVLKPGGRLAMADILPAEGRLKRWRDRTIGWYIPAANLYPRSEFARRLGAAGFDGVDVKSIADKVLTPFTDFARRRLQSAEMRARWNPLIRWAWATSLRTDAKDELDYVIAVASKR